MVLPPSTEDVAEVAWRTAKRVAKICEQSGRDVDGVWPEAVESAGALATCYGAASAGTDLFGDG